MRFWRSEQRPNTLLEHILEVTTTRNTLDERKGVELGQRRIKVRGIRKEEIDSDQLALVYWLMAKRAVEEKRQRDAEHRRRRRANRQGGADAER